MDVESIGDPGGKDQPLSFPNERIGYFIDGSDDRWQMRPGQESAGFPVDQHIVILGQQENQVMVYLHVKDPVVCVQDSGPVVLSDNGHAMVGTQPDIRIGIFNDLTDMIAGEFMVLLCVVNDGKVFSVVNHLSCTGVRVVKPHALSRQETFFQWYKLYGSVVSDKA